MKKIIWFILMVCVVAIASPAAAQDTGSSESGCDIASLTKLVDKFLSTLKIVKDGKPTDPIKVSDFLQTAANVANETRAMCDGLSFSGKKQIVIGPVSIPEGIYRAKATTSKYMSVQVDAISGECGVGTRMSALHLFNLSEGDATDGAEAVFVSKSCSALITIENVRDNWTLAFERITTD